MLLWQTMEAWHRLLYHCLNILRGFNTSVVSLLSRDDNVLTWVIDKNRLPFSQMAAATATYVMTYCGAR
jgi:hypothetical protein